MTIHLHRFEFETIIGILESERTRKQKVRIFCDIEHTRGFVDYARAAEVIRRDMDDNRYETVEEALEGVASALKARFDVIESIALSIYKPDILPNCLPGATKKFNFS
ncbi:MAG: dihydroneopterin aldolase [Campylobacterota bacterium]